jgi:hypothetical protein
VLNNKELGFRNIKNSSKMVRSEKCWISRSNSSTKGNTMRKLSILRTLVIDSFPICLDPRSNSTILKNTSRIYGNRQSNRKREG